MLDLTHVIQAVIALVVSILTAFVVPWIKSKLTTQQTDELLVWVDIAVMAAQQLYYSLDGDKRLEYALSLLKAKGYDVEDQTVRDAVEAAVLKLHQQLEAEA